MSPTSPAALDRVHRLHDIALRASWAELRTTLADATEDHLDDASTIAWEMKQHGGGGVPIAWEDLEHFVLIECRLREERQARDQAAGPQTTPSAGPWLLVTAAVTAHPSHDAALAAAATVAQLYGVDDDIEGEPGTAQWWGSLHDAIEPTDLDDLSVQIIETTTLTIREA